MVDGMEVEGVTEEEAAMAEALDPDGDEVVEVEDGGGMGEVVVERVGEGEGEGNDKGLGIGKSRGEEVDNGGEPSVGAAWQREGMKAAEERVIKGDGEGLSGGAREFVGGGCHQRWCPRFLCSAMMAAAAAASAEMAALMVVVVGGVVGGGRGRC